MHLSEISDLKVSLEELKRKLVKSEQEVSKLKTHKKVLKEEVVNLRQQINELNVKTAHKSQALKNLNAFVKKQFREIADPGNQGIDSIV